jgi:hypothetical protein
MYSKSTYSEQQTEYVGKYVSFMFCWPYISIHPCSENQLDALFILSLFRHQPLRVSSIFVANHQEIYCIYIQQLVFIALFSWLVIVRVETRDSQPKSTTRARGC